MAFLQVDINRFQATCDSKALGRWVVTDVAAQIAPWSGVVGSDGAISKAKLAYVRVRSVDGKHTHEIDYVDGAAKVRTADDVDALIAAVI